jgi:integrase
MKRLTTKAAHKLYSYLRDSIDPKDTILQLIFETASRVTESTELRPEDLTGSQIHIRSLKGSEPRDVLLSDNLTRKLERMMDKEKFSHYISKSKNPETLRRILTRHLHKLTQFLLGERINLHCLRHTTISILYQETKDIVLVQAWSGHRSINSTRQYVHLDNKQKANQTLAKVWETA